jgi:hypothetical protein
MKVEMTVQRLAEMTVVQLDEKKVAQSAVD